VNEKEKARLDQARESIRNVAATGLKAVLTRSVGSFVAEGYLEMDPGGSALRPSRKGLMFLAFALKQYDLFTLGSQTTTEAFAIMREVTKDEAARLTVEEALEVIRKAATGA
jgi:hypothetical protein